MTTKAESEQAELSDDIEVVSVSSYPEGVTAVIAGLGANGYPVAMQALEGLMDQDASPKSP